MLSPPASDGEAGTPAWRSLRSVGGSWHPYRVEIPADALASRSPATSATAGSERANGERAAYYRARAAEAMARARRYVGRPWTSDPGLRVQVEAILALPPEDRLRMLEAEAGVLSDLRPAVG